MKINTQADFFDAEVVARLAKIVEENHKKQQTKFAGNNFAGNNFAGNDFAGTKNEIKDQLELFSRGASNDI